MAAIAAGARRTIRSAPIRSCFALTAQRYSHAEQHTWLRRIPSSLKRETPPKRETPLKREIWPAGKLYDISSDARKLLVCCDDVNRSILLMDAAFLRDSCSCPMCRDPFSGQKKFDIVDIPEDIEIQHITNTADDSILITWRNDVQGYSQEHQSVFRLSDLRDMDKAKDLPHELEAIPWDQDNLRKEFISYDDFLENSESTARATKALESWGLCFITDVPPNEQSVVHLGERIGHLRETFYGRTWDVKDKPQAENVAYTAVHLGLHMDLMYLKNPPGFQLLHCINSASNGGISMFSDSFLAADLMRKEAPEHFEWLTKLNVPYAYTVNGHTYSDYKPVIQLSRNKNLPKKNNHRAALHNFVEAVNWSPPFQGMFDSTQKTPVDPALKQDMAETKGNVKAHFSFAHWLPAAKAFREAMERPSSLAYHKLEPGQCVIFNNRRILHGRTAFTADEDPAAPPRWLKGAYLDTQEFMDAHRRFNGIPLKFHGKTRAVDWAVESARAGTSGVLRGNPGQSTASELGEDVKVPLAAGG